MGYILQKTLLKSSLFVFPEVNVYSMSFCGWNMITQDMNISLRCTVSFNIPSDLRFNEY